MLCARGRHHQQGILIGLAEEVERASCGGKYSRVSRAISTNANLISYVLQPALTATPLSCSFSMERVNLLVCTTILAFLGDVYDERPCRHDVRGETYV